MQFFSRAAARSGLVLATLGALAPQRCGATSVVAEGRSKVSPITRVVELMRDMEEKLEQDAKMEQDLYETFVCWGTSVISQKDASNKIAQERWDLLDQYVKDLDSGKVELTSERTDLTTQINGLKADMKVLEDNREAQKEDFKNAKAEMQQAIDALDNAIQVLGDATASSAMLLDIKATTDESAEARSKEAASLAHAVELGKKVLSKGDAFFLQRILTGEVPKADWKKLNKKATFKMDYKTRSGNIQSILAKMKTTFESNLADAEQKDQDNQALYDKTHGAKNTELLSAQTSLQDMTEENGAQGMARQDSEDEKTALGTQIDDDKKFITQVKGELDTKKGEFTARKLLRAGEKAAVSEAISILRSDDTRDLFKRSYSSQGGAASFLQEAARATGAQAKASLAAQALHEAASKVGNSRLSALAIQTKSNSGSHFTEVINSIKTMIAEIKTEEATDMVKKEKCEKDRADDTRAAIQAARSVDENTEAINSAEAKLKEIEEEIDAKEKEVVAIGKDKEAAVTNRAKEALEYAKEKKDDEDAAAVVATAKQVIEDFYESNGLNLLQVQHKSKGPVVSQAGQAPPPPPSTWQAPYGGRRDDSNNILTMMDMIKTDIEKDAAAAKKEEDDAINAHGKVIGDMDDEVTALNGDINQLKLDKDPHQQTVTDSKANRGTLRGELATKMGLISTAEADCDFFMVNYPLRVQNRHTEIDGLHKARTILSSATSSLLEQKAVAHSQPVHRDEGAASSLVQARLRANRKKQTHVALA